jgi:hypothetical protein
MLENGAVADATCSRWAVEELGAAQLSSSRWPRAVFLLVVETPEQALSAALEGNRDLDVGAWSERWRQEAYGLLNFLHAGDRRLAVTLDDLLLRPDAVAAVCAEMLGLVLSARLIAGDPRPASPLYLSLARLFLAEDPRLGEQFASLYAACAALGDESAAHSEQYVLGVRALAELRDLVSRAAEASSHAQAVAQLRGQLEAARALHEQLEFSRTAECQLKGQVLRLQDELELALLAAHEERSRAVDLANQVREDCRDAEQALQGQLSRACAAEMQLKGKLEAADGQLLALGRANELLLSQVDQLQTDLEASHRQMLEMRKAGAVGDVDEVRAERLVIEGLRETPPYRELTLVFSGVRVRGRTVASVRMRLVEHHGHAGLVIFSDSGVPPPWFDRWASSGAEAGRLYMLLIPSDRSTHACFERMSATDWLMVRGLVALAEQAAGRSSHDIPACWGAIAARVCRSLSALPLTLRHDGTSLQWTEQDGPTLDLRLDGVVCGDRVAPTLHIRWPAAGDRIVLFAPKGEGVPLLLNWPQTQAGRFVDSVTLWVHRRAGDAGAGAIWNRFDGHDRQTVAAVFSALARIISDCSAKSHTDARLAAAAAAGAKLPLLASRLAPSGWAGRFRRIVLRNRPPLRVSFER